MAISLAAAGAVFAAATPSLADPSGAEACSPAGPYLSVPDRLYSVAGTSPHDVWAVGLMPTASLIMHWNGCRWSMAAPQSNLGFTGVSAVAPDDVWAVGATAWFNGAHTLAEHWNGRSWNRVASPTPDGSAVLDAVAAISASDVWAVGYVGPGHGIATNNVTPLVEHWNGTNWSLWPVPGLSGHGQLVAIAAKSADDVWAVGYSGNSPRQRTLTEHWNGSTWTRVPSRSPNREDSTLQGVTIIAPSDAWAVGTTVDADGVSEAVTEHWNGRGWTALPNPDPTGDTALIGVSGAGARDVWAVGYDNTDRCGGSSPKCQTVAMHWNGHSWTVLPTPNPQSGYLNAFLGVVNLSSGRHHGNDAWAVGTTDYGSTLIAHWNGRAWN